MAVSVNIQPSPIIALVHRTPRVRHRRIGQKVVQGLTQSLPFVVTTATCLTSLDSLEGLVHGIREPNEQTQMFRPSAVIIAQSASTERMVAQRNVFGWAPFLASLAPFCRTSRMLPGYSRPALVADLIL